MRPISRFDIGNGARNTGRKVFTAGFRHEAVILQAEANAPFLVVHADIHAEDHVGREDGRTLYHIVYIVADVM